ncbi:hypothetical protein HDF18_00700 [Mucilaginibacter sp. X5P1]|uniref:hypothetical protein n=1 Tax=Mucilaginibacter sp. X5P1 TaxID=2723088 RepID=UPI00161B167D|nr:hypothetical protein [Mucilaginibacter sp. X5P1]MBB6138384.1 hypothetical protein [Mucilaginibacter sp. X5P1]
MRRLTIISIILTFVIFILEFNYSPPILFNLFIEIVNIFLAWYLISILQFVGENIVIQTPFSIFLGLQSVILTSLIFSIGLDLTPSYPILEMIVVVYMVLMVFKVKNAQFSSAYKTYSIMLLAIIILKVIILFEFKSSIFSGSQSYVKYGDLLSVLPLYAILNIINKARKVLQSEPTTNDQVVS